VPLREIELSYNVKRRHKTGEQLRPRTTRETKHRIDLEYVSQIITPQKHNCFADKNPLSYIKVIPVMV